MIAPGTISLKLSALSPQDTLRFSYEMITLYKPLSLGEMRWVLWSSYMVQQLLEVPGTQRLVPRSVHRVQREHQLNQEDLHQLRADGEGWRERAGGSHHLIQRPLERISSTLFTIK